MIVLAGSAAGWSRLDEPTALAVGVFDGMHSGHRAVLSALGDRAAALGALPGVVTFDPHPLEVVAPDRAPRMITDIEQRLELLEGLGVGLVAVVAFDASTRVWSPEDFAVGLLARTLGARLVVAGEDFRFAKDRAGDVCALSRLGATAGFETLAIPLIGQGEPASSSALRELIAAGEVAAVAEELRRPHEVRGEARAAGDGLVVSVPGRIALPAPGVYAGNVGRTANEHRPAIIRIDDEVIVQTLAVPPSPGRLRVRFVARLAGDPTTDLASEVRTLLQGD